MVGYFTAKVVGWAGLKVWRAGEKVKEMYDEAQEEVRAEEALLPKPPIEKTTDEEVAELKETVRRLEERLDE